MNSKSIVPSAVAALPFVTRKELKPHSDLTFRVFDGLTMEGDNLHHSLLNGSLIRNCVFRGVHISRCDLEQIQVSKCRFIDVDFSNLQLTSARFNDSTFIRCKFDTGLIEESTWTDTVLEDCSFRQSVLQQSVFERCRLKANDYKGASIQLNIFRDSTLEDMVLGDCTFLNQIMVGCKYVGVRINAESIGSIYGLSEEDLNSFDLVYLGQQVSSVNAPDGLINSLEKDYDRRRWYFMKEMTRLNFGRVPVACGLDSCLHAILWPSRVGAHVRSGDIAFLELIILEMFRAKRLPALAAITLPETIRTFCNGKDGVQESRSTIQRLRQLANHLSGLLLEMLPALTGSFENNTPQTEDKEVTAQLTFVRKPVTDVGAFLNNLVKDSGFSACRATSVLREETGSYLLYLQTTILTLSALKVALWLLNGCAFQLIELKSRVEVIKRKRSPKAIQDRILMPEQDVPRWVASSVQHIFGRITNGPTSLADIAADFGPSNLKEITTSKKPSARRPNRKSKPKA